MRPNFVYVLMESNQATPLAVFEKIDLPTLTGLLPKDARKVGERATLGHRATMLEWMSETTGTGFRLIAYHLM